MIHATTDADVSRVPPSSSPPPQQQQQQQLGVGVVVALCEYPPSSFVQENYTTGLLSVGDRKQPKLATPTVKLAEAKSPSVVNLAGRSFAVERPYPVARPFADVEKPFSVEKPFPVERPFAVVAVTASTANANANANTNANSGASPASAPASPAGVADFYDDDEDDDDERKMLLLRNLPGWSWLCCKFWKRKQHGGRDLRRSSSSSSGYVQQQSGLRDGNDASTSTSAVEHQQQQQHPHHHHHQQQQQQSQRQRRSRRDTTDAEAEVDADADADANLAVANNAANSGVRYKFRCRTFYKSLISRRIWSSDYEFDDELINQYLANTEEEVKRLQIIITRLLTRLRKQPDEYAAFPEEECVICTTGRASMQTFPCSHKVLCKTCIVRTIQVSLRDRQLPLRCVVCRSRVVRLKQQSSPFRVTVRKQNPPGSFLVPQVPSPLPPCSIRRPGYM